MKTPRRSEAAAVLFKVRGSVSQPPHRCRERLKTPPFPAEGARRVGGPTVLRPCPSPPGHTGRRQRAPDVPRNRRALALPAAGCRDADLRRELCLSWRLPSPPGSPVPRVPPLPSTAYRASAPPPCGSDDPRPVPGPSSACRFRIRPCRPAHNIRCAQSGSRVSAADVHQPLCGFGLALGYLWAWPLGAFNLRSAATRLRKGQRLEGPSERVIRRRVGEWVGRGGLVRGLLGADPAGVPRLRGSWGKGDSREPAPAPAAASGQRLRQVRCLRSGRPAIFSGPGFMFALFPGPTSWVESICERLCLDAGGLRARRGDSMQ